MKKHSLLLGLLATANSLQSTRISLDAEKVFALGHALRPIRNIPRVDAFPKKLFIAKIDNYIFINMARKRNIYKENAQPIISFQQLETQTDVNEILAWMNNPNEDIRVTWYYLDNSSGNYNFEQLRAVVIMRNLIFNEDGTAVRAFKK